MIKYGKNRVYIKNLIELNTHYRRDSKFKMPNLSNLRDKFNNKVKENGNNLYNGLGNLLTTEIAKREKEKIIFLSLFIPAVLFNFLNYYGAQSNQIQKEIQKPKVVYSNSIGDLILKTKNKALLVQQKFTREDDIDLMGSELSKRNFSVEFIQPKDATKENLLDKIDKLAKESCDKSNTILYFANHGSIKTKSFNNGIEYKTKIQGISLNKDSTCFNEGDDFVILSPSEFYKKISNIKGKKAVIVDTCFSGAFTEYFKHLIKPDNYIEWKFNNEIYGQSFENLENCLVIASCPDLHVSRISKKYIEEKEISALMNGLYNLLNSSQGKINLSKGKIVCGNDLDMASLDNVNEARRLLGENYPLSYEMQRISDIDFILPQNVGNLNKYFLYNCL